jgi:hypothetical protein
MSRETPHRIGTRRESTLHRQLKQLYMVDGAVEEALVGDFVVDVLLPSGEIIEVQTGSFHKLRGKIDVLTRRHRLRIVYPQFVTRRLQVCTDQSREDCYVRKSPKHGRLVDCVSQLVWIADLLHREELVVEVVLIDDREIRIADGKGSWRRKGVSVVDRVVERIVASRVFAVPQDFAVLLPAAAGDSFTNHDLGKLLAVNHRTAAELTRLLRTLGIVELRGPRARANLYRKTAPRGKGVTVRSIARSSTKDSTSLGRRPLGPE